MDLLKSKIKPMYFRYLVTISGSTLVSAIFGIVDATVVGRYHGPAGNAVLAVFSPMWSFVYSLGMLAGIGSSVIFANKRGNGDETAAREHFTLSLFYGAALTVLSMLVIGFFEEPLFRFFGADDELLVLAKEYMKPIFFAIPCCVFSNILAAYLRNDGNPGLATKAVIFGGAFNAFGDIFFVFTLDMGIFGAGLATAIGLYLSTLAMLLHFVSKKNTIRFAKPTSVLRKIGNISAVGFSTAISDLAMGIISILFNRQIMQYLGADALAVYGVITLINSFAQCIAYCAGQAAQPIISQNLGAGQHDRIKECLKYGLYTCVGMGIFWAGASLLADRFFVNFFMTPTPAVLTIAPDIIHIYGLSFLLLPFNLFATYYFQAMMKANLSMIVSVARGVVVSGVLIMILPVIAGGESIWYAMLITELLVAAFGVYHMVKCTRAL